MPLPLAPIAGLALKYGAVALTTYAVTKSIPQLRRDQRTEDVLDDVEEGVQVRREQGEANASGRIRRVVRFGNNGPGVEVDLTALTRIRFRRVK